MLLKFSINEKILLICMNLISINFSQLKELTVLKIFNRIGD